MRENGSTALRAAVAFTVLLAGYLALAVFLGRHVPANTSVAGVPIGGMTPAAAERTLDRALGDRRTEKVVIVSGDQRHELAPAQAGLALDLRATVADLTGFSLKPADLWAHLTGGGDEPLRTSVDRAKLEAAVRAAGENLDQPVVEGAITFPDGKVKVVQPQTGRTLSVNRTADLVARRWPASTPVTAQLDTSEPKVSADEVQRMVQEFATPAVSAPVKVVAGAKTFDVPPTAYAPALSVRAGGDGRLEPAVDGSKLVAAVRAAGTRAGAEVPARDARITFRGTTAVVAPSVTGTTLDADAITRGFVPALTSTTRTISVTSKPVQPKLSTAEANRIKPREVISTFTTHLPYNPKRTQNIATAARTINGTYVPPGTTFSLNAALGERTAAKGYNEAPVIENGRLTKGYGGGISQLSTTLFNAVFFSGARIEEHHPHSFYISRYPEGREATISWPDVDNRWTNDTGYGIFIQAGVTGSEVTVTFRGTRVWDIEAVKGPRRNVVQPRTITDDRESCVPQTPTPGFDVTVSRIFKRGGKAVKTSTFSTHYIPEDDVRCTNPKAG